jgi:hypothetical protein
MSNLTIGNKPVDAAVLKIRRGQELAAREAAEKDGQDNVFFRLGEDTYVASGFGIHLHDEKNRQDVDVTYKGLKGKVASSNNEQDTKGDLIATGVITGLVTAATVGGAIAGGGALAFILAPVLGLFTLGIGGGFFFEVLNNRKKAKENLLAKYGTAS